MKFGQSVEVIKHVTNEGFKTVKGIVVGMKGNKVKVKQESYEGYEILDMECFGGCWVSKSQIIG
jgi:hypothetical protein